MVSKVTFSCFPHGFVKLLVQTGIFYRIEVFFWHSRWASPFFSLIPTGFSKSPFPVSHVVLIKLLVRTVLFYRLEVSYITWSWYFNKLRFSLIPTWLLWLPFPVSHMILNFSALFLNSHVVSMISFSCYPPWNHMGLEFFKVCFSFFLLIPM